MELGETIRTRRHAQGLTLDALSKRTSVSRAMLSEIERGAKNPTIRLVCQIADGLGTTVSELIGEAPAREPSVPVVVRPDERQTLIDPRSGAVRQILSPSYLRLGVEVLWYTIPPGEQVIGLPPARPGTVEHITVVHGRLNCAIGGQALPLQAGDSVFFDADTTRDFANPGAETCELVVIIDSSRSGVAPASA
jgi:transcriptional regulator with XRE-family HTH domain